MKSEDDVDVEVDVDVLDLSREEEADEETDEVAAEDDDKDEDLLLFLFVFILFLSASLLSCCSSLLSLLLWTLFRKFLTRLLNSTESELLDDEDDVVEAETEEANDEGELIICRGFFFFNIEL